MMYRKVVIEGYIIGVGKSQNGNIDKAEYEELSAIISAIPTAPDGYEYKLRADTLEWELVELPPDPDPGDEEATTEDYEQALADLGVRV